MARLPQPGGDSGTWGDILNDFLSQVLKPDGTLKDNIITNASIAPDAVNATSIVDGSISEPLLDANVQAKLNAIGGAADWNTLTNKPAVIAAGADQAMARAAIGAGTSDLVIGVTSTTAKAGDYVPTKAEVGLGNVDNTSDANKPVSSATQTALNGKAALSHTHVASQISDSTVVGQALMTALSAGSARAAIGAGTSNLVIGTTSTTAKAGDYVPTKAEVGLGNVDNTSDLGKPISTAQQAAFDAKADLVGGVIPSSQMPSLALTNVVTVASQAAMLALTSGQVQPGDIAVRTDGAGSFILTSADPSILGNWTLLDAPANLVSSVNGQQGTVVLGGADIGLGNVDNTSDINKPISSATQTALNGKADLVGGVIPTSQIPAISIGTAVVVANQAAMLALTTAQVQPGDLAVRTDGAGTFILIDIDPSILGNWTLLNAPTDVVTSVNSQTGAVVLGKADVGLGNVDNTSDATKNAAAATLTNKIISGASNTLSSIALAALSTTGTANSTTFLRGDGAWTAVGDTSTNTAISVDSEVALFSGTSGKTLKRATGTGMAKLTSGVLSTGTAGTDYTSPTSTETMTNKTITSPKINEVLDTNGNKLTTFTTTASAVNYLDIKNNSSTLSPAITATGSDSNISINMIPKGVSGTLNVAGVPVVLTTNTQTLSNKTLTAPKIVSGGFIADANGNEEIIFTTTASAVNEITLANAATGSSPTITASGGDTNVGINFVPKGSGTIQVSGVQIATTSDVATKEPAITGGTTAQYWRGDKSWQTLDKTAVGLANVDNTSDATKNAASVTLTNKTINFASNTITGQAYDVLGYAQTLATRAVGAGDNSLGARIARNCTFTSVTFRCITADASGNLVVELRKNGSQVVGTSTSIAAANQVTGATTTGSWSFSAGDILTVQITGVGTTPGRGLVADITGVTA
jgi:hypothetical protein